MFTEVFGLLRESLLKYTLKTLLTQFLVIFIWIILVSHVCTCYWIRLDLDSSGLSFDLFYTTYVKNSYYIFTTSSSTGYGDITIDHKATDFVILRYLYQLVLMYFGLVVNSLLYSLINTLSQRTEEVLSRPTQELRFFHADRKLRELVRSAN
jgi:hypothetical protein